MQRGSRCCINIEIRFHLPQFVTTPKHRQFCAKPMVVFFFTSPKRFVPFSIMAEWEKNYNATESSVEMLGKWKENSIAINNEQ